jgi:PleD family two-component response regulator
MENQPTLLVADDDAENLDVLISILSPDYHIRACKSGSDALALAKRGGIDLALLDIMMPDMSGFDVLAELRASGATHKIPVIFITGLEGEAQEETGFGLGAADYITKPFRPASVKARVRNQIQIVEQLRTIRELGLANPLAELPGKHCFDYHIGVEWNKAKEAKGPLSLLLIREMDTVDNARLRQLIDTIKASVKYFPVDLVARMDDGGDEGKFAVLLPGSDKNDALAVSAQIRLNAPVRLAVGCATAEPAVEGACVTSFVGAAEEELGKAG